MPKGTRVYRDRTCPCGKVQKRLFRTTIGMRCGECISRDKLERVKAPEYQSRAKRLSSALAEIESCLENNSAIPEDFGEIESLKEEMESWRDGMEGTGLENTSKFEEVSETADGLENGLSELESAVSDYNSSAEESYGGDTCSHCSGECEEWKPEEGGPETGCEEDCETCKEAALEDSAGQVREALSELENVSFPGMY